MLRDVGRRHDGVASSAERAQALGRLCANTALTVSTVGEHLTDDPVVFWLQVARRLPVRVVSAVTACQARC